MGRDAKFRGFGIGRNCWVYGVPIWDEETTPDFRDNLILESVNKAFKVDPESIGEYTGLKDKNGKEIYEGDVVRILYTDWPSQPKENNGRYSKSLDEYKKSISEIGIVTWSNIFDARFELFNEDWRGCLNEGRHGEKEIIGNIYENPELLEKLS